MLLRSLLLLGILSFAGLNAARDLLAWWQGDTPEAIATGPAKSPAPWMNICNIALGSAPRRMPPTRPGISIAAQRQMTRSRRFPSPCC